jgi:hypothetical protein
MKAFLALALAATVHAGETLPNGITLPDVWPPVRAAKDVVNGQPMALPYLKNPPAVIPIDGGRQLFVDDFLIESTTLRRKFHAPSYRSEPVLVPDQPWETDGDVAWAAPYSDGVWFDAKTKRFMMWYRAGKGTTCLALSEDGIHWTKPSLDIDPGTNIVLRTTRDAATVWLDDEEPRFKLVDARTKKGYHLTLHTSTDGVHWSEELTMSGPSWDRSTVFYNPFRKVWVASVRGHDMMQPNPVHRMRNYHEGKTLVEALNWKQHTDKVAQGEGLPGDLQPWVAADRLDSHHPDSRFAHFEPQLYNLDAFAYESLMVGLFTIWQGPDNETMKKLDLQKRNEVFVGFSRDGFHWDRTNRAAFLPVSTDPAAWNAANVQSAGGGCVMAGGELLFYFSGRTQGNKSSRVCTGLATLRRDGFASMNADEKGGVLTTRPVRFSGSHLFVNAKGKISAEVIDSEQRSKIFTCDSTDQQLMDVSSFAGKPVRIRFHLHEGALFSFWVGPRVDGNVMLSTPPANAPTLKSSPASFPTKAR